MAAVLPRDKEPTPSPPSLGVPAAGKTGPVPPPSALNFPVAVLGEVFLAWATCVSFICDIRSLDHLCAYRNLPSTKKVSPLLLHTPLTFAGSGARG